MIPPLDTHAHVELDIAPAELIALSSCIVAVTRRLNDYEETLSRSDPAVVWGAGCHPGLVREVRAFSSARLKEAVATTPVIGEVGLDGSARTPIDTQLSVLRGVLAIATEVPRILSIHSYRATDLVLRELREFRPRAAILHWWLGTAAQTEAALEAGAYFSINASQAAKWDSLSVVPLDRIFLETDHPFGDRSCPEPRRPGNIKKPEAAIAAVLGISSGALRLQTWRNLRKMAESLSLVEMFPRQFQVQFLAV